MHFLCVSRDRACRYDPDDAFRRRAAEKASGLVRGGACAEMWMPSFWILLHVNTNIVQHMLCACELRMHTSRRVRAPLSVCVCVCVHVCVR